MTSGETVKIEGRWYQPFTPAWPVDAELKMLQPLDSSRVELIELTDADTDVSWLVRCYNYRYSRELANRIPRTIDVYDTQNGVASKKLMIRFDYKDIRKITPVQQPN
jgi:hypothetical protein